MAGNYSPEAGYDSDYHADRGESDWHLMRWQFYASLALVVWGLWGYLPKRALSGDRFHNSDRKIETLQHRTLLNVKLQIPHRFLRRLADAGRVEPER